MNFPPVSTMSDEAILQWLDEQDRVKTAAVRQMLIDEGRPDLAVDLDRRMRDIALGLDSARNCWHSISEAQRRVLTILSTGRVLRREPGSRTRYGAYGEPHAEGNVCGIKTARALCAHELLHVDGTAFDPEAKFVLTERGRFVLKHGQQGRPT